MVQDNKSRVSWCPPWPVLGGVHCGTFTVGSVAVSDASSSSKLFCSEDGYGSVVVVVVAVIVWLLVVPVM